MLFRLSILGLVTETLHTLGEFLNGPNLVSVIMTGFRDCPQSQRLLVLYQHCCNSINDIYITPLSGVPLEKSIVSQLVKKFPTLYEKPTFFNLVYKIPPPLTVVRQLKPIYTLPFYC
jgi:hypothetical protein